MVRLRPPTLATAGGGSKGRNKLGPAQMVAERRREARHRVAVVQNSVERWHDERACRLGFGTNLEKKWGRGGTI
jgi:hypothetical protein